MTENTIKVFCNNLHSPKNEPLIRSCPPIQNEDIVSQKYFESCFRIDPVDGHLISDIEVLNDKETPSILKDYIQQHSCKVLQSSESIPNSLVDKIDPFDYIEPINAQSPFELEQAFQKKGVDVQLNSLE